MREKAVVKRLSIISKKCVEMTMEIDPEDYKKWENGMLIQDALPYLTPEEREFLLTGITPEEWKQVFKGTED